MIERAEIYKEKIKYFFSFFFDKDSTAKWPEIFGYNHIDTIIEKSQQMI